MELVFKKLSFDLKDTFFDYFEKIGFTDNKDFSMCFCLESHITSDEDDLLDTKEKRRDKATNLIKTGTLNGYLIYSDMNLIGWVNTDDKINYEPIVLDCEHQTMELRKGLIKVIYCIEIAPPYRRKGLAHTIVEYVCKTAKDEGFSFVESYPFLDRNFQYQYHGPIHLYEQHDFKLIGERSWFCIMQRKL